jgi:hypothetical protein
MEAVPPQTIYQKAIQFVTISGNKNRGVVMSLEGLQLIFVHNADCASGFGLIRAFWGVPV